MSVTQLTAAEKLQHFTASRTYPEGYIADAAKNGASVFRYVPSLFPLHPATPPDGFVVSDESHEKGARVVCERPFFLRGDPSTGQPMQDATILGTDDASRCLQLRYDFFYGRMWQGADYDASVFSMRDRRFAFVGTLANISAEHRSAIRAHRFSLCFYGVGPRDHIAVVTDMSDPADCQHLHRGFVPKHA